MHGKSFLPLAFRAAPSCIHHSFIIKIEFVQLVLAITAAPTCSALCLPSKVKGVVTMPTVRMPISFAMDATMGAAPLPVPPPIPACRARRRQSVRTISFPCHFCSLQVGDTTTAGNQRESP